MISALDIGVFRRDVFVVPQWTSFSTDQPIRVQLETGSDTKADVKHKTKAKQSQMAPIIEINNHTQNHTEMRPITHTHTCKATIPSSVTHGCRRGKNTIT